MNALVLTAQENSGAIDEKVFVGTFKFTAASVDSFDEEGFREALTELQEEQGLHITVRSHQALSLQELFGEELRGDSAFLVVETRMVLHMDVDDPIPPLVERIEQRLEAVEGVDGALHWFERREGSADFIRLMREIPQQLDVRTGGKR